MSDTTNNISLSQFYPANLDIKSVKEDEKNILIVMHSKTRSCNCPKCKQETSSLHATHHRKVQDLPILGKRVMLDINLHEFNCVNPDCVITSFTETFECFLNNYSYMTERLVALMMTIALETSCESCARILKSMNIKTSGDTVIRTLIKRYEKQPVPECGSAIGIDDFAFKKRHTYGTIIVDEATHKPVAVLDGRDGASLKEWLKKNKQVKTVTRDRASAYAKAVEEILPDCMQIADRFHLHQNLMEAVHKILSREVPATTAIIGEENINGGGLLRFLKNYLVKKIEPVVDNFTDAEQKRLKLIQQIQGMYQRGISIREITRRFQINRRTTKKYLNGDPMVLCRPNKRSNLDQHKNFIIKCLNGGKTQSETARLVMELGCDCGMGNARQYVHSVVVQYQLDVNKYVSSTHNKQKAPNPKTDYITRKGIFRYLWLNGELTSEHYEYLWNKYDILPKVEKCIREFREIFRTKKMPLLYLFIDNHKTSAIKEIASFARGLEKDISAVENAVASDLSNGYVEGTNSKVKMVKRTMYGRCSQKLLSAKLMYRLTS